MSAVHRDKRWRPVRKAALDRDGHRCVVCGLGRADGVRLHVDHIVRVHDGGDPWELTNVQTLCARCHGHKTGRETAKDNRARREGKGRVFEDDGLTSTPLAQNKHEEAPITTENAGITVQVSEFVGDAEIENVPPRFLSDRHPDAVGSRGDEWCQWMQDTFNESPRQWQRLVADRLLEVDADGHWCWTAYVVSVPRQLGKSWMLRGILAWLASQGQLVLGTTNRLRTAHEILRPLGVYARENGGVWRRAFDQPELEWPGSGGRVVFQADTDALGVGWSPQAGAVDEAWDCSDQAVTQGLIPAMADSDNPLLLLTSTVGHSASTLLARYRDAALAGDDVGIAEWSAPPGADWLDESVWQAATPEWSPKRLRFMRQQSKVLSEQRFRSQLLNQATVADDGWVPPSLWRDSESSAGALFTGGAVALEITLDGSSVYAVQGARDDQGVVHVRLDSFHSMREAGDWLRKVRPSVVLAPPAFRDRVRVDRVVGSGDIATAMPIFMAALKDKRIKHPGDPRLTEQVLSAQAKVTKAGAQTLISPDGRTLSAVRALLWAVSEVGMERAGRPKLRVAK